MQTSRFLAITDFGLRSGGSIDILVNRLQPYCHTAGAVTATNTLIAAITSERNNVHTLLADGVTEVAPTISAAAADDGGKLRLIVKELIDCMESNVRFGTGLVLDNTIAWLAIPQPNNPQYVEPQLFRSFVNGSTAYTYTANTRTRRAASIAAAYALYAAVASL
jgi:hypothetical protein